MIFTTQIRESWSHFLVSLIHAAGGLLQNSGLTIEESRNFGLCPLAKRSGRKWGFFWFCAMALFQRSGDACSGA